MADEDHEKLIDLSQIIEDNMPVYPGDIKTTLVQARHLSSDRYNNYELGTGMHSGTHVDSPRHMTDCNECICELPLESFIGNGCVLDVRNQPLITMKEEYEKFIKESSIVLLYTGWNQLYGTAEYYLNYPVVDIELCKFLIRKNIKMLGMDIPSPDKYPFKIHQLLFESKVCIIENLTNLDKLLNIKAFEVIAFPLKIKADSSIVRVVARIL